MAGFGDKKINKNAKENKPFEVAPSEKDHIDEALRAYQNGDIFRAKNILENATKTFPSS